MNTKTIFTIYLLLIGTMTIQAQELERFKDDKEKWGFKDQNGKIIITPKYDAVEFFSEDLVAVNVGGFSSDELGFLGGKWGFIDKKGKEVVPIKYDAVQPFSEGLTAVNIGGVNSISGFGVNGGKWGFVDKTGKEVIPLKYDGAKHFSEGLAAVNIGKDGIYTGQWGFIDKTGKEVIPLKYDRTGFFNEGLASVRKNSKSGFIDKTGKEIVPLKYDGVDVFSEGLAAVNVGGRDEILSVKGGKWGFVDNTGKEVIAPQFDNVGGWLSKKFKDGKVKVKKDGREFYIDKTGKEIEDDNAVIQKMATAYQSGNFTEAFKLAEQLANKHNADAMNLLGNMHAQGQGTKQNYGMARSWWEMASNKGNAAATGNIGLLYAQGWGVPQNMAEAEKWFKKGPIWATRKVCLTLATLLSKKATSQKPANGYKKPKPQDTHKPMPPCNKSMPLLQTNNNPDVKRIKEKQL